MARPTNPKVICNVCHKGFRTSSGFRWHLERQHQGRGTCLRPPTKVSMSEQLLVGIANKLGTLDEDLKQLYKVRFLLSLEQQLKSLRSDGAV